MNDDIKNERGYKKMNEDIKKMNKDIKKMNDDIKKLNKDIKKRDKVCPQIPKKREFKERP